MKRLSVVTAMALGVSLLASEAMYAAPVAVHSPVRAMFSREKVVKFSLHNSTNAPIKVKAGDLDVTVLPGKAVPVKLPVGAKIIVQEATPHYTQGTVLMVVNPELGDSTLELN